MFLFVGCVLILVFPISESHETSTIALVCSRPEMSLRQAMFDILVSEWCGKAIPLSREALSSALEKLRALRAELMSSETGLAVDMNKLISLSFWYEVNPRDPYPSLCHARHFY